MNAPNKPGKHEDWVGRSIPYAHQSSTSFQDNDGHIFLIKY